MIHNSQVRVLVIDDEPSIRNLVRTSLQTHEYVVEEAGNGEDGLSVTASFHPHLVILDLGLPDITGLEVLRRLRAWTAVPVIILTVEDSEETKVALLDAGANDYLTKPFGLQELLARIRVGLRHHSLIEATPVFKSGLLQIDLNQQTVSRDGKPIKLTSTEFQLLAHLVRGQGKVISQDHLLRSIWGPQAQDQNHYLRIYIGQLRKKLELNPSNPVHIITEPGVGYRIV